MDQKAVVHDNNKTRKELIQELSELRSRFATSLEDADISGRKQFEPNLDENQAHIETLIDSLGEGVILQDASGRILLWNRTASEMFGIGEGQIPRHDPEVLNLDTIREDGTPFPVQEHPSFHTLHTGESCNNVIMGVRRGAGTVWIKINTRPIFKYEETKPGAVLISFSDITGQKSAEQALRESEEKFRNLFQLNAMPLIISTIKEGRYVDVNDAFTRFSGYGREAVIGKTAREIGIWVNWEDRARLVEKMLAEGRIDDMEIVTRVKTGELRTCLVSAVYMDIAGEGCFFLSIHNVTEMKHAEKVLRESEERFFKAFISCPAPLVIADIAKGTYIDVNEQWLRMTGYAKDEVIGRTSNELGVWIDPGIRERVVRKLLEQGYLKREPVDYKIKSGQILFVQLSAELISFAGRSVLLSMFYDETERQKAEDALRELNKTLEQRVAERTELAESRAQQLQALAMELIQAEERERHRIAGLLHEDLQQVLAAAKMQVQTVIESHPVLPLLNNVESMLTYSIEQSRQLSHELSPPVLHHSGMATALNWLVRQMNMQFGLEVELAATGDPAGNTSLNAFVFRAVKELLFNITKHAGVKEARVTLSCVDGNMVVKVIDQGKGFDPRCQKNSNGEFGLGLLSISERARYIGGGMTIESAPDCGSCITLTLPLNSGDTILISTPLK